MKIQEVLKGPELDDLTLSEKIQYCKELKELVLSLPFDEKEAKLCEERYLTLLDICLPIFKTIFRPNINFHTTELPKGPNIVICNHLDSYDQIPLSCAVPKLPLHYMIAESFEGTLKGQQYKKLGAFVVDRNSDEGKRLGYIEALKYLFRGFSVALMPEGHRWIVYGSDGTVQKFHSGFASMAQLTGANVIPNAINNDFRIGKLYVNRGVPFKINLEDKVIDKTNESHQIVTDLWQENRNKGALIRTKKR
ncbi:MAG: 1-acyl-sn-glycerol-3-phosphate acyltransferase [Mollicutes bacterium]|jgi:1-acyl-sn-glycerol-3-phosphate acyltransferase|nr:1-acyl-sn-glycerol-3-phosphate acyltransferase [Mollicutes bacterium]